MKDIKSIAVVILAAGKGTRMNSDIPKVMHRMGGKPMVEYVIQTAGRLKAKRIILVVGHKWEQTKDLIDRYKVEYVIQEEQLGTGHAVLQTQELLADFDGDILILYGDVPLLTEVTLNKLLEAHRKRKAAATVLTAILDNPSHYGRILRDRRGMVQEIVEVKDASTDQIKVKEINTGIICFDRVALFSALKHIKNNNKQREYYLTDAIKIIREQNLLIGGLVTTDPVETLGINSPEELSNMERILLERQTRQTKVSP
jgi:UDP-N-acetylglucosamine diphosphorylase/glucosamine-1-phosphate N-acetyltransferase